MLEIYPETYYEIFDPQNAKQVALFFDEDDAKAYLKWRNKKIVEATPTEEAVEDGILDSDFVGVGLVVNSSGGLGLLVADGPQAAVTTISDVEARNLAAQIDAVLE